MMEITLPCSEHESTQKWYEKSESSESMMLTLHYAIRERVKFPIRESYAKHLAERRRREYYLQAFMRFLDNAEEVGLEQRFREQADKWQRETGHLSSPMQSIMHPSYQAILGMGRAVVPLLLRDMQQNRRAWFWALSYLTNENPINSKDAGKMDKMIKAWVNWGKDRGLL